MKKQKNTKKILLSSVATLAIAGSAAAVALTNSSNAINFNSVDTFNKSSKNISSNVDDVAALKNPDQALYISQDLPKGDSNGNLSDADIKIWTNFNTNLQNLINTSQLSSESRAIADQMTKMYQQIQSVKEYANAKKTLEDSVKGNPLLEQALPSMIELLKQQHISNGGVTSVDEIQGIDDVRNNLLKLSGIVEGTKITQISNPVTFKKTDLTAEPGSGLVDETISINNVAGADYQQLVKIAELESSQAGNYALNFEYSDGNSVSSKGTIYIKNDNNQLASTPGEMIANFDIFGRTFRDPNNTYGQLPQTLDNFIFQKNDTGNLEILVRVKSNEIISNIEFATQVAGVTSTLLTPSKFGILDVQATIDSTFRSIIVKESVTTLVNDIDSPDIAKTVQIFSDSLTSKSIAQTGDQWENDRQLEFYQVGESEFLMPLYYASKDSSNVEQRTFGYNPLEIYSAGAPTGGQYKLKLATDGAKPTELSPATYEMFSGLREQLPEIVASRENFEKASTITLDSMVDTTNKITRQTLKFSDFFYAIGSRSHENSWVSVLRTGDTPFIAITDPTQKVFFEKPLSFIESATTQTSTTKAVETTDERQQIISILGSAYVEFSKSNSGVYAGQNYKLENVTIWDASGSNGSYSNIKEKTKSISGSANDLYNQLNNIWAKTSSIISQLFSIQMNNDRYTINEKNTGRSIVENYLANQLNEFTPAYLTDDINQCVLNAIDIVKKDGTAISSDTTFASLTNEKQIALGQEVANLIKYQLQTIWNELSARIYQPAYDAIEQVINNAKIGQYKVIKAPTDLLETYVNADGINLIKYKENAWKEIATQKTTTIKEVVKSIFNLIYFKNTDGISLGNSIIVSQELSDIFANLNADSLVSFTLTDPITTKKNKVQVYDTILTFFGGQQFSIQDAINKMLEQGKTLDLGFDLSNAFLTLTSNISSDTPIRKQDTYDSKTVYSYYLDDVIAGTNAIIALNWKLVQLGGSAINTFATSSIQDTGINPSDVVKRIQEILTTNAQAGGYELSIWSNIINGSYDYTKYANDLSGRNGASALDTTVAGLINENNIMASRYNSIIAAEFVIEKIMKYLWWIIIALIGVGILVSSSVGIATKNRQVKLSSRPVLKWLLISGIVLGLAVATLAIIFGVIL